MGSAAQGPSTKNITIKTRDEIQLMAAANQIVAEVLVMLEDAVEPGITTYDLDGMAQSLCEKRGAKPAFKGYRGFPASLCVSINEQVVHGIPSRKRKLKKGDIVSFDFGTIYQGYFGDSAISVAVGRIDDEKKRLLTVTEASLMAAIEQIRPGNRVADIGAAVQGYVEQHGFSVVRQFVGHGIGAALHEGPEIPNFVQQGSSPRLREGMVVAVEPMVNVGTAQVKVLADGWTVVTQDGRPSAHFEHSIAVTEDGPRILSSREKFVVEAKIA